MGPRKTNKSEPSSSSESASGRQDSDYQAKRARNNEAVKRSREKAREKAKETSDKVIRGRSLMTSRFYKARFHSFATTLLKRTVHK